MTNEKTPPVIKIKKRRAIQIPDKTVDTPEDKVLTPQPSDNVVTESVPTVSRKKLKKEKWRKFVKECIKKVEHSFPGLLNENGTFRLFKIGMSDDIAAFIQNNPECGLTMREWCIATTSITGRRSYLKQMISGATRYDQAGNPAGTVSEREAGYAANKLSQIEEKHNKKTNAQVSEDSSTSLS